MFSHQILDHTKTPSSLGGLIQGIKTLRVYNLPYILKTTQQEGSKGIIMKRKVACIIIIVMILITGHALPADKPLRTMRFPEYLNSDKEVIEWQNNVRKKLVHLLKLPSTQEIPQDFAEKEIKVIEKGAITIKEIEIQSTKDRSIRICLAYNNETFTKKQKSPAVVCIHGHGGNRWSPYNEDEQIYHQFGNELTELGFVTISTDVGQHQVYEEGRTLMGERLWDLMRCVDYLSSTPWVDSEKIGCAGLSLGGEMAMWLGALDTRIKAVCVSGFLTYMDQMEQNHCMCWKFPGLRELVDFPDIYALIAPRALLCQNGKKEPPDQFPPSLALKALEEIRPAYKIFNKEESLELIIHEGGHEIEINSLKNFIRKHLYCN